MYRHLHLLAASGPPARIYTLGLRWLPRPPLEVLKTFRTVQDGLCPYFVKRCTPPGARDLAPNTVALPPVYKTITGPMF